MAQNTRTGPKASVVRSIIASTSPSSDTSQPRPIARSPIWSATAWAPSSLMSTTATPRAPSSAKRSASARPMPDAAPVTTQTFPSMSTG